MSDSSFEALAQQLAQSPDHRVLRRIQAVQQFHAPQAGQKLCLGLVLDTETTGMDLQQDAVIELGMIKFEFDPATGELYRVLAVFDELEDPGFPVPPQATQVNGITTAMVKGKRIDDAQVRQLLDGVDVVLAHNAGFDRPFVEQRWPEFAQVAWACSLKDIDWKAEGLGSAKLEYLAYSQGWFYDAHRAVADCWALLHVLGHRLPQSQQSGLLTALEKLNQPQLRLAALGSPFDTKDLLKARGYRWDPEYRTWYTTLQGETALQEEKLFLKSRIYGNRSAAIEVETLDGLNRYSIRSGHKEQISL